MKTWNVCLPIAGHAYIAVEANNGDEAIEQAMDQITIDHIESWEALEQFNAGNVCYCPQPWYATAEAEEEE